MQVLFLFFSYFFTGRFFKVTATLCCSYSERSVCCIYFDKFILFLDFLSQFLFYNSCQLIFYRNEDFYAKENYQTLYYG